jgi:hypothetical protein
MVNPVVMHPKYFLFGQMNGAAPGGRVYTQGVSFIHETLDVKSIKEEVECGPSRDSSPCCIWELGNRPPPAFAAWIAWSVPVALDNGQFCTGGGMQDSHCCAQERTLSAQDHPHSAAQMVLFLLHQAISPGHSQKKCRCPSCKALPIYQTRRKGQGSTSGKPRATMIV